MKFLKLVFFLALGLPAAGQQCAVSFNLTAAGSSAVFNNLTRGCVDWTVTFNSTGFSGLTFTVETAPNNAGVPGAWSAFTAASGSNPSTATTQATATFSGYFPFIRATLSGLTGTGTVSGLLYGTWTAASGGSGPSTGCSDPCAVIGVDAAGAASTGPPVQVAGNDGSFVRRLFTMTNGRIINNPSLVSVALADAVSNTILMPNGSVSSSSESPISQQTFPMVFGGTTWERIRGNTLGLWVQGPVASGSTSTGFPVLMGGYSGTNTMRSFLMDTLGGHRVASGTFGFSDGASNNFQGQIGSNATGESLRYPTMNFLYDRGSVAGWVRQTGSVAGALIAGRGTDSGSNAVYYSNTACDSSAVVTIAAGATTEVVALTASKNIRVCSFAITGDTALGTFKFVRGTGSNCGTGTADLSGAFNMGVASNVSLGSGAGELFKTTAGNALCITTTASAANGILSYAIY